MLGLLGLRKQVSSEEQRNNELVTSNTTIRKQVAKLQAQEVKLKKRNAILEGELAVTKVSCAATEAKVESIMKQMKTLAMDVTLHDRYELMEEYKVGKLAKWDPD